MALENGERRTDVLECRRLARFHLTLNAICTAPLQKDTIQNGA